MAEAKKAEEPEKKVYRGEVVKLGSLEGGQLPAIVQFIERSAVAGQHGRLPLFGVIHQVDKGYSGMNAVWYRNPRAEFVETMALMSAKMPVNILTGKKGVVLAAEYDAWGRANVGSLSKHYAVTMGADPEVFVVNKAGEVIPAWMFLPDKKKPVAVNTEGLAGIRGTIYWDGFQAEYTMQAQTCLAYFCDTTHVMLSHLAEEARKYNKNAKLSIQSVLPVPHAVLAKAEDKYVQFGCMPSQNAYGMSGKVADGRQVPFRFAGGHIHFGIQDKTRLKHRLVRCIKAMDAILGVACVSLFASFDNPIRREWYGLAGEYRTPPHGLEYRVLSNAWLSHPLATNVVYELARRAFAYGWHGATGWEATEAETIDCINGLNVELAHKLLVRNREVMNSLLKTAAPFAASYDTAFKFLMGGLESGIKHPDDIEGNWRVGESWTNHCESPGCNWGQAQSILKSGKKV